MRLGIIAFAFLLALVTGCGSETEPEGASPAGTPSADGTEATSGSGEQSPTDGGSEPTVAKRALRQAISTMRQDDATGFEARMVVAGDTYVETTGVAVSSGWESSSAFTLPTEDEPSLMDARSTNGTVWMRMHDWTGDSKGCWLEMSKTQVPLGMLAMTPDQPVYYSLLAFLGTSGFANEAKTIMVGDLRATAAIGLLTSQLVTELDLASLRSSDRVPVEIGYDGSRITYVSMAGSDVLQTVEDAGGPASDTARLGLGMSEFKVAYTLPDEAPTVSAPPANLVVTVTPTTDGCR